MARLTRYNPRRIDPSELELVLPPALQTLLRELVARHLNDLLDEPVYPPAANFAHGCVGDPAGNCPPDTISIEIEMADPDQPVEYRVRVADMVEDVLRMHRRFDTGAVEVDMDTQLALLAIAESLEAGAKTIRETVG